MWIQTMTSGAKGMVLAASVAADYRGGSAANCSLRSW
jgi:hypothetical protein